MIIGNFRKETDSRGVRLKATISWEDNDRSPGDYHFGVEAHQAHLLGDAADAFFCGALVPALSNGERRIKVDAPVCPSLLDNAEEALFWLRNWYPQKYRGRQLSIEADKKTGPMPVVEGSVLFMSGGVDSSFTLLHNLSFYPPTHPARVRRAIVVYGFDIGGKKKEVNSEESQKAFQGALDTVSASCDRLGVEPVPLYTNIRHLDDTSGFWGDEFVGAALSSTAHALGGAGNLFYISSAGEPLSDTGNLALEGTHPLLDPCYSSYNIRIKHYAAHFDSKMLRLSKLTKEPVLFNNLRVCYDSPPDRLNCEVCEKCIRNKLQLEVLGLLEQCGAFSSGVNAQDWNRISIPSDPVEPMYHELLRHLRARHHPLEGVIVEKIKDYKRYKAWKYETNWRGRIKRLDRKYARGCLARLSARLQRD